MKLCIQDPIKIPFNPKTPPPSLLKEPALVSSHYTCMVSSYTPTHVLYCSRTTINFSECIPPSSMNSEHIFRQGLDTLIATFHSIENPSPFLSSWPSLHASGCFFSCIPHLSDAHAMSRSCVWKPNRQKKTIARDPKIGILVTFFQVWSGNEFKMSWHLLIKAQRPKPSFVEASCALLDNPKLLSIVADMLAKRV